MGRIVVVPKPQIAVVEETRHRRPPRAAFIVCRGRVPSPARAVWHDSTLRRGRPGLASPGLPGVLLVAAAVRSYYWARAVAVGAGTTSVSVTTCVTVTTCVSSITAVGTGVLVGGSGVAVGAGVAVGGGGTTVAAA